MGSVFSGSLAVLGAGHMGGAIAGRAIEAGLRPASVSVTTLDEQAAARWRARGVNVAATNTEAVGEADVVLVSVKPQVVAPVLDEIGPSLKPGAVVVSVAAGVALAAMETHLPEGTALVRVMPNTPAMVGQGMSAVSPSAAVSDEQLRSVTALLASVGRVVVVPEPNMDAVTAVSGSGPAYVYLLAEAMIDAGVVMGLTRDDATTLATQTILGAGAMLVQEGAHPTVLREQVMSPGGTTAAAIAEMERGGFRASVLNAMEACRERAGELA